MSGTTFPQVPRYTGNRLQYPALVRKLHGWELLHLRQLVELQRAALDQAEQERDQALRRAHQAEDDAERWRDEWLQTVNEAGLVPGLTVAGHVVALPQEARQ